MSTTPTTDIPQSTEGAETGAESAQEAPNTTDEGQATPEADEGTEGGNGEAARRRRQLRDTEAERDALAGHLERHRIRDLERAAGVVLAEPSDLLALGGQGLDAFVNDEGDVDADAVQAAARSLVDTRPGLRAPQRPTGGLGQGRIGVTVKSSGTSWAEALGR